MNNIQYFFLNLMFPHCPCSYTYTWIIHNLTIAAIAVTFLIDLYSMVLQFHFKENINWQIRHSMQKYRISI